MKEFWQFISLTDANVRNVVLGVMLLSATSAVVGCFAFLRKRSLVGDAVAHAVLPGICLAFMITLTKNPLVLLLGASLSGLASIYSIDLITKNSKLKADAAVAIVLSVFFGLGLVLLSHIQHSGNASQSGLDKFLFGKAASLTLDDIYSFASVAIIMLVVVLLFYKEFKILCFDSKYAHTLGLPVSVLEMLLSLLTVLAVVIGIQAVGVVLMAAMLITPAVVGRSFTNNLTSMIFIAAFSAIISSLAGTYVSFIESSMPTGPWIVFFMSMIAFLAFMFAPKKGILSKYIKQLQNKAKIREENLLKIFYNLGEKEGNFTQSRTVNELSMAKNYNFTNIYSLLFSLRRHGYIEKNGNAYTLTKAGYQKGKRVTKAHRLWESYLSEHLLIPADHVHHNADAVEHLISPELEQEIRNSLTNPNLDPHQTKIPK